MHCPHAHAPACFSGNQDSPTPSKTVRLQPEPKTHSLSGYQAHLIMWQNRSDDFQPNTHQHNKFGYHKVMAQLARMILGG